MIETNRIELKRELTRELDLERDNFEVGDNYIRMIVPYNWIPEDEIVDENVQKNVLENNIQLTERQKNIINRLSETGEINVLENVIENVMENSVSLANYFDVSERTIRRDLQFLQKHRYIRHIGPDKGGKWQVINKNNSK